MNHPAPSLPPASPAPRQGVGLGQPDHPTDHWAGHLREGRGLALLLQSRESPVLPPPPSSRIFVFLTAQRVRLALNSAARVEIANVTVPFRPTARLDPLSPGAEQEARVYFCSFKFVLFVNAVNGSCRSVSGALRLHALNAMFGQRPHLAAKCLAASLISSIL